jgi:hypothetical protein
VCCQPAAPSSLGCLWVIVQLVNTARFSACLGPWSGWGDGPPNASRACRRPALRSAAATQARRSGPRPGRPLPLDADPGLVCVCVFGAVVGCCQLPVSSCGHAYASVRRVVPMCEDGALCAAGVCVHEAVSALSVWMVRSLRLFLLPRRMWLRELCIVRGHGADGGACRQVPLNASGHQALLCWWWFLVADSVADEQLLPAVCGVTAPAGGLAACMWQCGACMVEWGGHAVAQVLPHTPAGLPVTCQ